MRRASICLSMIVKNEAPVIERCLISVLPYIDNWVVIDTGSSDDTRDIVREFFARVRLPGDLLERPWRDFATNRTEALRAAQARCDYTLVIDADDVLEVAAGTNLGGLSGDAHAATLVDGILRYTRTQLVRSALDWSYRGVLHEFITCADAGPAEVLPGLLIHRNHDGARRRDPHTYANDATLLEAALRTETDESLRQRYNYYLGQSYRDAREPLKAAEAYARRAGMAGWEEERWHARLQSGRALLEAGDEAGFLKATAQAYTERPQRVEPLIDLARFFRMRGRYEEAMQAAKLAASLPYPEPGALFVDDYSYRVGVRQELSIAGYYCASAADRQLGRQMANALALDRNVPPDVRWSARNHLTYYARPVAELCASWRPSRLSFQPPAGYVAMNPSVCRDGDELRCIIRALHVDDVAGSNDATHGPNVLSTRNFLCRLSTEFEVEAAVELEPPSSFTIPIHPMGRGLEDLRLFTWRGTLWCLGCTRKLNDAGLYEMVLAPIEEAPDAARIGDWRVISDLAAGRHEKNWTAACAGELRLLYSYDPAIVLRPDGSADKTNIPALALDHLRGGTPAIPFESGWLSLTHEVQLVDERRIYLHRFVSLDPRLCAVAVSEPFFFDTKGLEFAAGLCWSRDDLTLLVSFGVKDAESWIAAVDASDVRQLLTTGGFERHVDEENQQ